MNGGNGLKQENVVVLKSKAFAIRIIRLYQYLKNEKKEYILAQQILRCGTSIGANVKEAVRAQTKPDFITKMNISLKEASETEYWIELLYETNYLTEDEYKSILKECVERIKILTSIVKTSKIESL